MPAEDLTEPTPRREAARAAVVACGWSVAWAALVGIASLVAGVVTRSLVLVAFGLDSVIDGTASGVLVWRFTLELRGIQRADRAERAASRIVGVALLLAAAYVSVESVRSLLIGSRMKNGAVGFALVSASLFVLPILALIKLRLARELRSTALRGDGVLSAAGGALAALALIGLLVERMFNWSSADAVAALLIAVVLVREGWRTLAN